MKTRILLTFLILLSHLPLFSQRQKMVVHFANGARLEYYVEEVDSITFYVEDDGSVPDGPDVVIATGEAADVTRYSMTLTASADITGRDADNLSVGMIYSTESTPRMDNGTLCEVALTDLDADGRYSVEIQNLAPSTRYYYRAYMRMGDTWLYGKVASEVTEGQGVMLSAAAPAQVTSYSARIDATINVNELDYKTLVTGVCYGNTASPVVSADKVRRADCDAAGAYTVTLVGLYADTIYYYRPYAVVDGYITYGAVSLFRTTRDEVVATGDISDTDFSVTSTLSMGSGKYSSLVTGVCYGRGDTPTVSDACVTASVVDDENRYSVVLPLTVDTWYYRAYVIIDGTPHYGDIKTFTVESSDTRESVDLGLSVKWATCNVGATQPSEYGDYFAWGMTEGYADNGMSFNWANYKWCSGAYNKLTKYCTDATYGAKDGLSALEADDDAATILWGAKWRVPTPAEYKELREQCTWKLQTAGNARYNGVAGYEVTGPNGNSIFLPAAGYRYNASVRSAGSVGRYWSNSISETNSSNATCYDFSTGATSDKYRYYGFSIRAVCVE